MLKCTSCNRPPPDLRAFKCPTCGGIYDFAEPIAFDPAQVRREDRSMWRYRHTFGLPETAEPISLAEGGTPLLESEVNRRRVLFKCEHLNPTGAFKDRGMSLIATQLAGWGVAEAVEDSSGNAGAAFSAYAARAGIRARVFVPESASGPKRAQIEAHGAEVRAIPGPRSRSTEAAWAEVERHGVMYASHVYNPLAMRGYATIAYEIGKALGQAPEAVIAPAGHGTLLLGIFRGFEALRRAGVVERTPRLYGVQALACAPLYMVERAGASGLQWVTEGQTLAEGIRVRHPVRGDAVLAAVRASGGGMLAFDERAILNGRNRLARLGLYVEATSAVVWPALEQLAPGIAGDVVAVLTGTGYKSGAGENG